MSIFILSSMLLVLYPRNHYQENIEILSHVSFWTFYSFSPYVYHFKPFWPVCCMWYKIRVLVHSFVCEYPVFPTLFVGKIILFWYVFLSSLSDVSWPNMCRIISRFFILFHWLCVCFMLVQCCFDCCSFATDFKCDASNFVLLSQNCFSYSNKFYNFFLIMKKCFWHFDGYSIDHIG